MTIAACLLPCLVFALAACAMAPPTKIAFDRKRRFRVELGPNSPVGEASIREHAFAWHPGKNKYYLLADVVPLDSPHHPNTYETEIHLWSGPELDELTYHGVAVPKGKPGTTYDGYGVASPAGIAYHNSKVYVPFSARKTATFGERGIGLAWHEGDPETLPWTKTPAAISHPPGSNDDPAVVTIPGDPRLHLYHRCAGPQGYRILHTASATPEDPASWPDAAPVTPRPDTVRAQELTGAAWIDGAVHLFIIEHLTAGGMRIAHLRSLQPEGPFAPAVPSERYLLDEPDGLAYSGHFTPVVRDGRLLACFWTAFQKGPRYGLLGHPAETP